MDQPNNEDEPLENLKDMLIHLNPIIKMTGNIEATNDMLVHLPELDPLFHQLKLVKGLRKVIRDDLSVEVERAVEKYLLENKGKTRAEPPVEHLVKLISENRYFNNLALNYDKGIVKAMKHISYIGEDSFFDQILENDILNYKDSPMNSSEHSLNSSLNQSGFLFLHPAQYNIIAQNLHRKDPPEAFNDALNMLLVVTPGEPVSQEAWGSIKKSLKKLLLDNDDTIFNKVLRIHARLLASQVHDVVVEGYLNLLEAIASFWLLRKYYKNLPDSKEGISLKNNKLMMLISVLLKFIKEFSVVWVRYPSKHMTEIIDQTLSLFMTSISAGKMSALDILSIADPKASWIYCWMHGRLGRQKVCESLSSKTSLLFSMLSSCISYIENNEYQNSEILYKGRYSSNELSFLIFSHSFHFIVKLLHHADGVALFPVSDPVTQQHISVKKFMTILQIPFINGNRSLAFTILNHLTSKCQYNEIFCRIVCDSGLADFLANTIPYSDICSSNIWYYELVVDFFLSLNHTTIGHKYILLGTLQRISLATLITNHDGAIGRNLCTLAEKLLLNNVSQTLVEKSVALCLEILFSPLGKYLYFNHTIMPTVINILKSNSEKYEDFESASSLLLENSTFFIILKALVHCYEGIIFLDKNFFLEPILIHLIKYFAERGQVKLRLLNTATSSKKGAKLLSDMSAIKPFWGMVTVLIENEVIHKVISVEEDKEPLFSKAILPLVCLATSYEGTVQLFGENGIIDALRSFLDESYQDVDVRKMILYLICSATASLDKIIFMQGNFNVQERLLAIEKKYFDEEMGVSFIDDSSVLIKHIISACQLPQGIKSDAIPIFYESRNKKADVSDTKQDNSLMSSRGNTMRSKDIWKFLNSPESRSPDTPSLTHCRRTYRLELAANSFFKVSTFLDIIDFTIGNLANSADELLPEELLANYHSMELNTDCDICHTPDEDNDNSLGDDGSKLDVDHCNCSSHKFSIEFMIRYAIELKHLSENSAHSSNMLKLCRSVHANLLGNNYPKTDWISLLFYIMSGGCVERTCNIMECLRSLRVGSIIWPALYPSLVKVRPPHAMLYAGVIQAVKLLLYRDSPDVYVAYETFIYI